MSAQPTASLPHTLQRNQLRYMSKLHAFGSSVQWFYLAGQLDFTTTASHSPALEEGKKLHWQMKEVHRKRKKTTHRLR